MFSLPFVLYLALLSSNVQTFLIGQATDFLKNKFGLTISIGRIDFRPLNRLVLERVYVEDLNGDTLAYIHSLTAGLERISLNGPGIYFDKLDIDSLKFHMLTDSVGKGNLFELLDLFASSDTITDTTQSMFRLYSHTVFINRSEFIMRGYNPQPIPELNYDNMRLRNLNAKLQPFDLYSDTIRIGVKKMSASDHCGLVVESLSMNFAMEPTAMKFDQLTLEMGKSRINSEHIRLHYLTDTAFSNFENDVALDIHLLPSFISTDDLAWFAADLKAFDVHAKINGHVFGPLNNLQARNLNLNLQDSTFITSSFTLKGLPDVENLYFDVDLKELSTTFKHLENLTILKDSTGATILPVELKTLTKIHYRSKIKGSLSNISATGTLNTNLGTISHQISYSENNNKQMNIDGWVDLNDFQVGTLTDMYPTLDKIKAKIKVNARFNPDNSFAAQITSKVKYIDIEQYSYQNIDIDGEITDKYFDGDLSINDPNVELDFTGKIEYGTKDLKHRFILNLPHLNLYGLGFDPDSTALVQFDMVADFSGLEPDNIKGKINLYDLVISRRREKATFADMGITMRQMGESKLLQINSDFFNMSLSGQYSYNTLSDVFSDAIKQYLPAMAWSDKTVAKDDPTNLNLRVDLRDIQPVINLFDTTLKVSHNSIIEIHYKANGRRLDMKGTTSKISYFDQVLNNITIASYNEASKIVANISAEKYDYLEGMSLKNLSLNTIIENNLLTFNVNWNNYNTTDTTNYSGYISSQLRFPESGKFDKMEINILPSNIVISDTTWNISPSSIKLNGSEIEINNFAIGHRNQYLLAHGKVSDNLEDTLFVNAKKINIGILNIILQREAGITISGILTADVVATNLYKQPFVLAQVEMEQLSYNGQLIGDTKISSTWDPLLEMIHIDWISTVKNYDVLYIVGDYDPTQSFLNFRLFIDRFDLSILNPYMEGILHDLSGLTTAEIIIKGKIEKPKIEGVIIFDRTTFVLDYTQTRYQITDWIDIAPDAIIFSDLRIVDKNNNYMFISGKVQHDNFDDIALDVRFNARNFMFLNTLEKDNDTFYGTVYASGSGSIKGALDKMDISLGIKTEPNTRFFIPLNSGGTASQIDYITFVAPTIDKSIIDENKQVEAAEQEGETEINLMLNLEVTPDAEVQIIFDPTIGDIIKAKGSSNLTIYMPPNGDLEMFGDYIISEGEYLFTLQDIFQKRFAIAKGSSITWQGDPANASIDLDAVYRVRRANLYDLTFNSADEDVRLAAEAHLLMTGTFMAPSINFKVSLPATAEEAQEQINGLQSDEISKQVISLLILNRFQPLPGAVKVTEAAGPSGVESNASELLSNQVSNWLSQISKSFDVGFNYTPGGETSSTEMELALSTQLLNNRITINTNFGVGGQQVDASTSGGTGIAGDFEMEVKLDKRGKIRFKGYAKSDNNTESNSKQGAGVFYREEFNTLGELWEKIFKKKQK
jgi:hypothetical protein